MKILYVITGLGVGGAERQVCDLADWMDCYGTDVKVAYLLGPVLVKPRSVNVELVNLGLSKSFLSLPKCLMRLVLLIRSYQPDVIHSHMVHANLITRLTRLFTFIRVLINTAHSVNEGGKIRMFMYCITDSLATISTNVSTIAVHEFYKKGAFRQIGRMIAVPNGIDTSRFKYVDSFRTELRHRYGVKPNQKIILAVGRLYPEKDYPNLIKAFDDLTDNNDLVLWIIGDGPIRSILEKYVSSLKSCTSIRFLGVHSDVHKYYSAADVFVLPSAWEGFGLVVAEAMASERIVVATDCGGVAEVLGDNGYLVPPRNPHALSRALQSALKLDSDEAEALGHKARQFVKRNYSLDAVGARWLALYTRSNNFEN